MSNKIQICNQALAKLGEGPIVSFDDNTTPANTLSVTYEPTKQAVLRSYAWNCATRTVALAKIAGDPADSYWSYQFAMPNKALRVIKIIPNGLPHDARVEWLVEGSVIYTQDDNVACKYVHDIAESQMDPHVEKALVAALVAEHAYAFTASPARETNAVELADRALDEARITDSLEQPHVVTITDQLRRVR